MLEGVDQGQVVVQWAELQARTRVQELDRLVDAARAAAENRLGGIAANAATIEYLMAQLQAERQARVEADGRARQAERVAGQERAARIEAEQKLVEERELLEEAMNRSLVLEEQFNQAIGELPPYQQEQVSQTTEQEQVSQTIEQSTAYHQVSVLAGLAGGAGDQSQNQGQSR